MQITITDTAGTSGTVSGDHSDVMDTLKTSTKWFGRSLNEEAYRTEDGDTVTIGDALDELDDALSQRQPLQELEALLAIRIS